MDTLSLANFIEKDWDTNPRMTGFQTWVCQNESIRRQLKAAALPLSHYCWLQFNTLKKKKNINHQKKSLKAFPSVSGNFVIWPLIFRKNIDVNYTRVYLLLAARSINFLTKIYWSSLWLQTMIIEKIAFLKKVFFFFFFKKIIPR